MKPFISLCMIVKNEEKVLSRCLESVAGVVDEIIIVDTGSSDKTKEIASEYTKNIYDYEWTNNFANARNYAGSKANGKWILVLDADEFVDKDNFRETIDVLKRITNPVEGYSVKIYNFLGVYGEQVVQHNNFRIYKNDKSIYYFRSIHEQLGKENGLLELGTLDLVIYHSGYLNKTVEEKNKHERNSPLVNKELENGASRAFDYFNLGNEYFSINEIEAALGAYKTAYMNKESFNLSWVSIALVQVVNCLIRLKRYDEALNVIHDAEQIWSTTVDFKCLKANIYFIQNRFDDVEEEMLDLLKNEKKYNNCILNVNFRDHQPHFLLGNIYALSKNYEKAVFHYVSALNVNNIHIETISNLMYILEKKSSDEEILSFVRRFRWTENKVILIHLIKVFLSLGNTLLSFKLLDFLVDNDIETKGLLLKKHLISGNLIQCYELLGQIELKDLSVIIKNNYFDIYDILILGLLLEDKYLLGKIEGFLILEDKNFLEFIQGSIAKKIKKSYYINVLERCIQLKEFELFEKIVGKRYQTKILLVDLYIGHLLYKCEFKELSIDFYSRIDVNDLDSQGFINIITFLLESNQDDQGLEFVFSALEREITDFRIFKLGIEILTKKNIESDKESLLKIALHYYPNSNWLKDILLFG
ncbi:tetratricopeptide repeat-containing glycosyltransferase family 2 protein [Priestia aryabhattai]|uniref:tetratricopeptide repeat-containing glycosyltransferase family 2 protein n=1 Tax=Priestia aryabhattai TaxID=412384 RepID=UPI0023AFC0E9|nr:glycosyltransferase family 2 protein [Priestia aryabhattai]MDE8675399.1 glycosyltransferase family 2 protein [Priestia aryabhattai]